MELTTLEAKSLLVKENSPQAECDALRDYLSRLSDERAEVLARMIKKNYFNSLTALTDAQAEELSQHKGALWLDGLTTLSNPQAEALAKHDGILFLNGLTTLSESAAPALRASPKRILPDKFKD